MKIAMYLFLGLCAAAVAAYLLAPKLHRFAYWSEPKTAAELRALATGGWQLDWLEVEPGLRLAGLVRPPRDPAARWLLFVPGNSPTLLAGFRAELDRLRGDDDVGMALYAYRGFDGSGGTPTPAALVQDLVRQWDHLVQRGARRGRIEVWGYSLGAVLAPQLGAALAARGEAPARLVLAAAAPRITVMPAGRFGRFLPADVYD
ncbi:MAG: hypothetical protein FJ265_22005, partial [Planctomycetes bacterium]|nr:hypothetical protein [Planctomycetota bacterium]